MEKKTPYQVMTSVLTTYKPTLEEKQSINSFFFCRYLSNNPISIFTSSVINRYYSQIPIDKQYDIAKQLCKDRIKYIQPYKKDSSISEVIENISKFYKVNLETAKDYYDLLDDEKRIFFRDLYKGA